MSKSNGKFKSRRNGSSQIERYNAMLNAHDIKVDERSLAHHIDFLYQLAEKVKFYNLKNKAQGNWQQFFGLDESILLARISIIDIAKIDHDFQATLKQFESEFDHSKSEELFVNLYNQTMKLVSMLNQWYRTSLSYNLVGRDTGLGEQVQNAVSHRLSDLFEELLVMSREFNALSYSQKIELNTDDFDKIWGDIDSMPDTLELFEGDDAEAKFTSASKHLTLIFKEFLRTITYIVNITPRFLEESIQEDDKHAPQNALLITFLKLYQYLSDDINETTQKHLDYYFFHRLEQKFKPARPDRVYIYFTLADNVDSYHLKEGTLLEAGVDEEGVSYLYRCDSDLDINKAILSDVKVVYVSKNPLITDGVKFKQISNIYHSDIASSDSGAIDFESEAITFPTFGEEQFVSDPDHPAMTTSKLGFAVSSPVLVVNEGIRSFEINLKFDLKSMSSLVTFLENYTKNEQLTAESAFDRIFSDSFEITLSTLEGWYQIVSYKISPSQDWSEGVMKVSFVLDQSAPPIAAFEEGADEAKPYDTPWPVIRFLLSADDSMYTYSYLNELKLEVCEITVDVKKVKNVKLFNNLGKLDTGNPFYPFGSVPTLGSYLLIGHDELYKKKVEDISFDLVWHNLPRMDGGFEEYYERYKEDIGNDSFKVSLTSLSGYEFLPKDSNKAQTYNLFETLPKLKGEANHKRIRTNTKITDIDIEKLQIKTNYSDVPIADYDNTVKSGYMKLELMSPPIGFGHDLYPTLFAGEVVDSASSPKKTLSLPNIPYIPQLRSLEVSYKASTQIIMSRLTARGSDPEAKEKLYHVHPFGIRTIYEDAIPNDSHLVPQFNSEGYLMLGFENLEPGQTLTLYFLLEQDIGNDFEVELPKVGWEYLANDEWVDLKDKDVIFDGTNGFTVSGVIKLHIPKGPTMENTILPTGKLWLAAKVNGDVNLLSKTKGIFTQALSATWVPHKEGAEWESSIPPYTIERLAISRAEIASVIQPAASFFGRNKETLSKFYLRISERLRHKNRAVTGWDFEHLILQRYPFIEQVKCLLSMDDEAHIKSGTVLLVVTPEIKTGVPFYEPKLNYDTLNHIQNYVSSLSTPFLEVIVANPVYERLKVTASILFVDNSMKGEYILRLNEELRRFICPWFYDRNITMTFGENIQKEDVFAFIESREYVRFITKLSVIIVHNPDDFYSLSDSADDDKDALELSVSRPWNVLIPVESHQISVIEKAQYESPERAAIERMKLGEDFILAEEDDEWTGNDFSSHQDDDDQYYAIEFDL